MKKYILLSIVTLLLSFSYWGQQTALNSQYMFNDFAINPAVAGTKNYTPLSLSFRRQWMGINDAPVTQSMMAHTFFGEKSGIGAHVFNDVAGPTRRTGFSATFGHQIQVGEKSVGAKSHGLLSRHTQEDICVGHDDKNPVDAEAPSTRINGKLTDIKFSIGK